MLKDILDKIHGLGDRQVVLELDLARGLIDVRPTNPLQGLQLLNAATLSALRSHLHEAAREPRVAGLLVHAVDPAQPLAVLDEVGELIERFGESKPTAAWAESFGEFGNSLGAYTLASAAHQVWLQPTGELGIGGLELDIVLLRGLLEKVGVTPQFGQRKEYKTAADQFAATGVTEANREMVTRMGQSIVEECVATIAERRGLDAAAVWDVVNDSPVSAQRALDAGLVDRLGYRDEVYAASLEDWGAEPSQLRFVQRWSPPGVLAKSLRRHRDKVAVVNIRGSIVTGRGQTGGRSTGSDVVDEQLRACLRDDGIKVVLLDVDSPGGSAVASDFIRRSVLQVRESGRPVVARMGAVAASGGYYVSMGADEIVAQATTLTGSIGVLAGKFVTNGLYEKLDLKRESIRIGANAGMMRGTSGFSPEEWAKLDAMLDRVYENFTRFAAQDRGMAVEELEPLARGRVWSGADALRNGLVDKVGGWRVAYERACELADVDPEAVDVVQIGQVPLIERLTPARSSESRSAVGAAVPWDAERLLQRAAAWLGLELPGALSLPFRLEIR